ncbi:hypothetical protein SAMN05518671_0011 [Stenotrophomonas lactitubi]|nr:hypothetical protein SAMN04487863_3425 [Stenotrophomonas sp. yr243]SNS31762.1 hypothetical protein SAMN05518671_0011 [Stenotrophomonas lactitubi]
MVRCTLVVHTPLMKVHHAVMWVLFLAMVVAARIHWPEPEEPEILAYRGESDEMFSTLRRHAFRFAESRAGDGFEFLDGPNAASSFQIQCRGVPVLYVERRHPLLLISLPLGAGRRAPAIFHLQATLEWPLQPLSYLEQSLAGVQEPIVQDRLLLMVAGGVPEEERCE